MQALAHLDTDATSVTRRGTPAARTTMTSIPDWIAGRFRVLAPLGHGGMGDVLLAEDAVLGRRVAIKRPRPPLHLDAGCVARLRREARIGARMRHRAIAGVLDLVCDRGVGHLVMEHVDGPSLRVLQATSPLEPRRVARIGAELALGLAHVHDRGVVHLDVKSENVLLGSDGQPRLVDFGIARDASEPELAEAGDEAVIAGTPRAMSPEQIAGAAVDGRSDLFSLGVLLYELLTATTPFAGAPESDTVLNVLRIDPTPVAQVRPIVPPAIAALVDQLLEKAPARRPASALEVHARLVTG